MKNKSNKVSLLVYIKKQYRYSTQEERLSILADKLGGKEIGGGTCLATGKRDKQYFFNSEKDTKLFLSYPTVKQTILKEYDLVDVTNTVLQ